jgi:hypothetical protein
MIMPGVQNPHWAPSLSWNARCSGWSAPFAPDCKRQAGWHGLAIDHDRAGSAFAAVAAGLGSGEARDVAQIVDEQHAGGDSILPPSPVQLHPENLLPVPWHARLRPVRSLKPNRIGAGQTMIKVNHQQSFRVLEF